jgi:ABC-2 type transport system ATP-binding protein
MTTPEGRLAAAPDAGGAQPTAGDPRPAAGEPRPAIETQGLTKRYPRLTALSDCSITVPPGRISALVGPNGAGKTTLLRMLAGLARPTAGTAAVLGAAPRQDPAFLAQIGYLAQEIPLYRRLSADDHIQAGAHLNPRWDDAAARARLSDLRVPLGQAVGTLSGGQRAQVALTLALAKQPRVLLLDEPVAALDPLARRQFLATLTSAVADAAGELTVLLSSHVIADVERICDHMVLLTASRVQLCGDIEELLAAHKLLVGPRKDTSVLERTHTVVQATRTERQSTLLVRLCGSVLDPAYQVSDISLEDLVLAYLGADAAPGHAHLTAVGEDS